MDKLELLTSLARRLTSRPSLEEILQHVCEPTAVLLGVERVSVRIFDASRSQLIAVARAGQPLHASGHQAFRVGDGLIGWIAEHARSVRSGEMTCDPRFVARPGLKVDDARSFLGVPMMSGSLCTGVLTAVSGQPDYFTPDHERLAELIAAIASPWVEVARLERLSTVDPLTGALNRRGIESGFGAADDDRRLTAVMIDLDHFKRINDHHGHAVGDAVLRIFVDRIATTVRAGDALVRLGGEEFALLLPCTPLAAGLRIAERARRTIAETPFRTGDASIAVTASFGVAERREGESRDRLLARADGALYAAKVEGRNTVHSAD